MSAGLTLSGVARYGGVERGVSVVGIVPEDEARVSTIAADMTEGRLAELDAQPSGVVMGHRLAERLGAGMGDLVTLTVSSGGASGGGSLAFRVVGLFHTGVVAQDEGRVYLRLKSAQALAGRPSAINDIRLRLRDAGQADAVAARAEALLGRAISWREANSQIFESFAIRNAIMAIVVGAILLVAGFGVFNIVSILPHEKARDVAILKSLGFPARDIRLLFLLEGLAMDVAVAEAGAPPVVEARGVSRILPGAAPVTLVADVDLRIEAGEFTAITGPSGSGKSALLYLLGLLDAPTKGDVLIEGRPTSAIDEEARARLRLEGIGFVFKFHFLLPEFDALDNVALPISRLGRLRGAAAEANSEII